MRELESIERRQKHEEVCSLRGSNAGDCMPVIALRSRFPDCCCSPCTSFGNISGLLHNLEMLEGTGQGRQSCSIIPVQESWGWQDLLPDGRILDNVHNVQMDTSDREYSDGSCNRVLGSSTEQHDCPGKAEEKNAGVLVS